MADGIVLAAGFGSRLGGRPKAFLPLGGTTALERAVAALSAFGVRRVLVIHNARWAASFDRWRRERPSNGLRLETLNDGAVDEDSRRGAAGDLSMALGSSSDDCVVLPVDTVFTWSMDLFRDRLARFASDPAVAVRPTTRGHEELGRVDLDEEWRVRNFYGMPRPDGHMPWAPWVWLGPAWLPATAHPAVAEYCAEEALAGRLPDSLGGLVAWLARRSAVRGVAMPEGEAYDVGTPCGLAAAQAVVGP